MTLFGIFLTPVFFSVIQRYNESKIPMPVVARWVGSAVVSGAIGLGIGYVLVRLELATMPWGLAGGGLLGVLAAWSVLGIRRLLGRHARGPSVELPGPPEAGYSRGVHHP